MLGRRVERPETWNVERERAQSCRSRNRDVSLYLTVCVILLTDERVLQKMGGKTQNQTHKRKPKGRDLMWSPLVYFILFSLSWYFFFCELRWLGSVDDGMAKVSVANFSTFTSTMRESKGRKLKLWGWLHANSQLLDILPASHTHLSSSVTINIINSSTPYSHLFGFFCVCFGSFFGFF